MEARVSYKKAISLMKSANVPVNAVLPLKVFLKCNSKINKDEELKALYFNSKKGELLDFFTDKPFKDMDLSKFDLSYNEALEGEFVPLYVTLANKINKDKKRLYFEYHAIVRFDYELRKFDE